MKRKKLTPVFLLPALALTIPFIQSVNIEAATVLSPGDISILGFHSDTSDAFAFVTWVDLDATTTISFTDHGWTGSAFTTNLIGDGIASWTTGENVAAGTIIQAQLDNSGNPDTLSWSLGIGSGDFGNTGLSAAGDTVLAFQGSSSNPDFLFGITSSNGEWQNSVASDSPTDSTLPTDLNNATANFRLLNGVHVDNGYYSGGFDNQNSFDDFRTAVLDPTNWTTSNNALSGGLQAQFPVSGFTIIPEASTTVFLTLSILTLIYRRKS